MFYEIYLHRDSGFSVFIRLVFVLRNYSIDCIFYREQQRRLSSFSSDLDLSQLFLSLVGYLTPLMNSRFGFGASRLVIDGRLFNRSLWLIFIVFMLLVLYTAPAIPLLGAFKG